MSRAVELMRSPVVYAADLIAFCDSQKVTIGPPIRPDGSGWLICSDADGFDVKAWGPISDGQLNRLSVRCATLTEALTTIHSYEMMLPQ